MATRSLGQLTLDLVAKIGGFTAGMTEAERVADRKSREIAKKNRERAKEVEKAWSGATKYIAGAFAGLSVAGLMRTFIQETVAAQNEQTQLAAVLKSTGEAAGFSANELNKMAASMAGNSTFSEGEITRAQTRLLSYTGIVGEQFPEAMQAVIDMSARMGMSVEQSAETIGRALDIPSQGLSALQRQGFRFTEEQKKAAEELERTGRVAEAQAIILDALKSSYGGAASAARNTFGGAISALQNQLRSLMTGEDGSLEGTREAIEALTNTLGSAETKQAFATLISSLSTLVEWLVKGASAALEFGKAVGIGLAIRTQGPDSLEGQLSAVNDEIRSLENLLNKPKKGGLPLSADEVKNLNEQLAEAKKRASDIRQLREGLVTPPSSSTPAPRTGGATAPNQAEIAALAAAGARREAAERAAKDAARQAQAYLENLKKQLQATENLSVAETVLRDIQAGRIKLAGGVTEKELISIAKQIDAAREFTKSIEEQTKAREAAAELQQRLDDQAVAQAESMVKSNQALREEIEMLGLEGEARLQVERARINGTIALKEEELAMLKNADASATQILSLEREIELLRQRSELLGQKTVKETELKQLEEEAKRQEQAYKNIQDALGQGLYDIATGNFKNIGQAFTQMLTRMATEAIAADLMKKIFGSGSSSGGGGFGDIFKVFGSLFGGGRANGGPVMAGGMYQVNENGPEMLSMGGKQYLMMGNQGGTVTPNAGGKSVNMTVVQQFAPGTDRRTTTQAAADARRQLEYGARNL
jgi:PAS domain-containing protein